MLTVYGPLYRLWSLSIVMHGLTVTPVMRWLDRSQGRDPDKDAVPPPGLQGPAEST
jgi:hypothetical protein